MNKLTKKFNKKAITVISVATLLGLGVGAGGTAFIANSNHEVAPASANDAGTKEWLQYGTLKYDLRGPSGRIYKAGTKVVRKAGSNEKPNFSIPKRAFYLTLQIGGLPGNNLLQDNGGGYIAEAYVNISGDWTEIDYPSTTTVIINNTTDYTDLKSSDFHPVDSSNPDIPHANIDELNKAYAELVMIGQHDSIKGQDRDLIYKLTDRYMEAKKIGVTQAEVDQLITEINQAIANYKKTGHLTDSDTNINKPTDPTAGSGTNNPTVNPKPSKTRYVKLRKASYRYTRKGKRVSKKLLKKGSVVKINGKVYRIKGKTFYRIAKNRYIRVVNVAK